MVLNMSSGDESSRLKLLRQLQENSEFLENQMDDLKYILNCKIFSFYETQKTPTVAKVRLIPFTFRNSLVGCSYDYK